MVTEMVMISSVAAALSAATSILRKLVFKKEDYAKMAEIQQYNRELMNATRKKDQKTIQKLQKKKAYIQQINAEVTKKNLITMFSSLMIFFTVYPLLVSFFGDVVVGVTPIGLEIPFVTESGTLRFYGWFILSFFGVSSPITKVLGLGLTGMQVTGGEKDEKKPSDTKQKEKDD
ncbi:MAG: EMC3/TMCO1 family protein [Candidatus Caldarchaeum sp.]|nr:EMC3/TMCO1 family protein [Candidatus Caldarchaeum sp.]